MKHAQRHRGGFVLFIAITMIVVVVAAMLVLGQTFTIDAQRTQHRSFQAQLDQLLFAGAADVREKLANGATVPATEWNVELPEFLKADAAIRITPAGSTDSSLATFDVRASIGMHIASQRIIFTKTNGSWKLTSAELIHGSR